MIVWSARLSLRSPPRSRRWRTTLAEEAGIGGGPARRIEGGGAGVDGARARADQPAQGLAGTGLARACESLPAEERAGCPERVERIVFATLRSPLASGPIDLEHPLTPREQEACQPGPVATGALDRPGASARRMRPGELERVAVALPARLDDRFQQKRAARGGDQGERVRITVRVDADDDVERICNHLFHLQHMGDDPGAALERRSRTRQDCQESRPRARTGF